MKKPKLPPGVRLSSGRYYRVQYLGMVDGKQKQKWHPLTRESDGMAALFRALAELGGKTNDSDRAVPARITAWLAQALPGLSMSEQKEVSRMAGEVSDVFKDFRTDQVQAKHILAFLQQWTLEGKLRAAQRYRDVLNKFFKWVILQGDRMDNPVDPVSVKAPPPRSRYMTDAEFLMIRDKLLGDTGHKAASGPMMQVYVDLLYLTGQSGNEIRTLRWAQVDEAAGVIHFERSKIKKKVNAKVDIPITAAIADALARAREIVRGRQKGKVASITPAFVVSTLDGVYYKAKGVSTAWERARERAGILDVTLKDLRAKHATDAKRLGYSDEEIGEGLAHADPSMTRVYLKQRMAKTGRVELSLPKAGS